MNTFDLSEQTRAMLNARGWRDGTRANTERIEADLRAKGIEVSPIANCFLQKFNGLFLQLPDGGLTAMHFNAREALTFLESGDIAWLSTMVGQSLCPVGLGGRFLLFIAPSGEAIFLQDERLLYLRVRNVHDAFEVIRTREFKDFETVWIPEEQQPSYSPSDT